MRIGNWPLLLLALEHIIKHRDMYEQMRWISHCGTTRCLAGWIVFFAGWRSENNDTRHWVTSPTWMGGTVTVHVEDAALISLELDPQVYGTEISDDDRSVEMTALAADLFGGGLTFELILETVRDLAKADGVTPTPLIVEQMLTAGILSKGDTF